MNIIVFGTGSSALKFLGDLDIDVHISFFSDNNPEKHHTSFMGYPVYPPDTIKQAAFDYVVIASQYSAEIMNQLTGMGIPSEKIIPSDPSVHQRRIGEYYANVLSSMKAKKKKKSGKLKIAVTNFNFSYSNGYALIKHMPDFISNVYQVDMIREEQKETLVEYDVIISSNHEGIYDGKHINIELWHGFPIKRMGMMHEDYATQKFIAYQQFRAKNIQLIMSYSALYSTFFNACYPNDSNKYRITGMPRNDLLFGFDSKIKLENITGLETMGRKVVFFMPTWRKGKNEWVDSKKEWSNLFGFDDENPESIVRYVEDNQLILLVKLHPFEYNSFKDSALFQHDHIYLLSDETLDQHGTHLYEILGAADLLITDYSSVFFDTLLLDKPVIFVPTDLDVYSERRGFLLDPYQTLAPGPVAASLDQMDLETKRFFEDARYFGKERKWVRNLVFRYTDDQASIRVWQAIDQYLSGLSA